ncbi:MAG TPA: XrtA/PEP-CTERM system histidine kinase PrsK [Rhizorhapis sp.]
MGPVLLFLAQWGHALAAALYAALAIWTSRRREAILQQHLLTAALALTAFWALCTAVGGNADILPGMAEGLRNFAWLSFMFVILHRGERRTNEHPAAVTAIYTVLGIVLMLQWLVDIIAAERAVLDSLFFVSVALRMMVAVGALVLVHNLYTMSAPEARWGIRLSLAALTAMWTYDLNLYTFSYLTKGDVPELYAMRGCAMAVLVPVFALGAHRNASWKLRLSRTITFQSLSLVAIGAYLIAMVVIAVAAQALGGDYARVVQISFVFVMLVGALVLLPSGKFRAWFKVKIAKHFFQHRYDYRNEWIRFTNTIGRPGEGAAPFYERVVKAIADITESPAGVLLLPGESGALSVQARWNWRDADIPAVAMNARQMVALEESGWIIELDQERGKHQNGGQLGLPSWMIEENRAWALVPLIHFERLAGAVLLARPLVGRELDWEDLDMLRVVGRQVASYISEAQGQEALSEAQRFEEFNRRFAFIMHDIKNLVSQLSLVARNARRHADNPEFRADMIATLEESVGKMNDMLARLSQHNRARYEEPRAVALRSLAENVVAIKGQQHPVILSGDAVVQVMADPVRLEQILNHLVQNAIDASTPANPVTMRLGQQGMHVSVEVIDRGCGMSAEFIRSQLFKPFVSNKEGGFGIGAFEARALAAAMNGRIDVESREGEGSRFTLILPVAVPATQNIHKNTERAA